MDLLVRSVKKRMGGRICPHISLNFDPAMQDYISLSDLPPPFEFLLLGMLITGSLRSL